MRRLEKVIDIIHKQLTERDWDNLWILVADEGTGKSHLALHILEYWYKLLRGKAKPEDVKHINLDIVKWAEDLKDCKRFDLSILDEAGDLSSKRSMSNLNHIVARSYQIIRGDNLFTILILPDLFALDGFFTKRRARAFIHIKERGRFAFWSRERLRKVVALNQFRYVKNYYVVPPNFRDTFPKYKGMHSDGYANKKKEYMADTRKELYETVAKLKGKDSNNPDPVKVAMLKFRNKHTVKETAEAFGVSESTVKRASKEVQGAEGQT